MAAKDLEKVHHHLFLCEGEPCSKRGACEITTAIRAEISRLQLDESVHTTRTRCNGRCEDGPIVIVYPEGVWYRNVSVESGAEIVARHLAAGLPVTEKILYQFAPDAKALESCERIRSDGCSNQAEPTTTE
jgi:(2Fe-2S) ferredoxin